MESSIWLPTTDALWRRLSDAHGPEHGSHASHVGHSSHGETTNQCLKYTYHSDKEHHCLDHDTAFGYVEVTMAIMLFGLFFFNNLVLYFVNYRDENIRENSYKMMNTTISIFAAVMMNASVFAFLCEQVIPSPWPRGFNLQEVKEGNLHYSADANHEMYFIVGLFVFCGNFALINWLCWRRRDDHHDLFAVESITGHLCAFSGIYCFGNLMELHLFSKNVGMALLVVLLALVVTIPLLLIAKRWRGGRQEQTPDIRQASPVEPNKSTPESHTMEHWAHSAQQAEDEAVTLLTSFLISQVVGFAVVGELPEMHHDGLEDAELHKGTYIGYAAVFAALLLFLGTFLIRRYWDKNIKWKEKVLQEMPWIQRLVPGMHRLVGMLVSWFLYRWLEWHTLLIVPKQFHLAHTLAAFVALIGACIGILILDRLGDKARDLQDSKNENQETEESARDRPLLHEGSASSLNVAEQVEHVAETAKNLANRGTLVVVDVGTKAVGAVLGEDEDTHIQVEDAFRNLINSIAVFVGLSWEKAFDVAEHTIVMKVPGFQDHHVISKVFLAICVCAFMLPGWYWYIMPKAIMDHRAHKERIDFEVSQEQDRHDQHAGQKLPTGTESGYTQVGTAND